MNFTDFTRGHLLIIDNDGFPLSLAIHLVHKDGEIRFKHPQGVLLGEDQICKLQLRVTNYKQLFFRSIVLEGKIQKAKQADLYKFVVENISHEVIDTQNELISQLVSVLPEGQKPIQEFNQQLLDEILYEQNQGLLIVNTANNTHVNRILCVPNSGNLQFETEIGNKLSSILQYVTEGTIIFHYKNKSLGDISLTGNIKLTKKLSKTNVYTFDPRSMIYGNQSPMESLQIRDNTIFSFKALYSKVRIKAKYWYNLLRLPLLLFSLIPVFVGSALAQPNSRNFEIKILILEILAVVFFQSAANLLNDYFDHKSDSDDYAVIYTKLNAGSRFLQLQLINVDQIKIYSIFSLLLGAAIGLYINLLIGGIDILVIGI
ncbi:MAG: prenyltransferase, partial [Candidatus Heimdallarchaeota archaeon]